MLRRAMVFLAASLAVVPVFAHTVWLEPASSSGVWLVRFGGHAGQTESFDPSKLGEVRAWNANGQPVRVDRRLGDDGQGVRIEAAGAALLAASFDNGYWSKGRDGRSRNVPMTDLAEAVSGVQAIKFHKTIASWSAAVREPVGQPFEVVPLAAERPRAGEPLRLRVLIDGRPAAGIALAQGEEGRDAVTDAKGEASLPVRAGWNRVWAGQRLPVTGDPRTTQRSIEYSLGFLAR